MTKILIDTNIWYMGLTITDEKNYKQIHKKARIFLEDKLKDEEIVICMSVYQIGEIMELLRRAKIKNKEEIYNSFFIEKFIIKELKIKDVKEAYKLSSKSNIHIYDYFVVLPVKDIINKIYSADDHLQHKDFTSICEVINPLEPWILREGRKPEKKK